jgi:hypothetical protein
MISLAGFFMASVYQSRLIAAGFARFAAVLCGIYGPTPGRCYSANAGSPPATLSFFIFGGLTCD